LFDTTRKVKTYETASSYSTFHYRYGHFVTVEGVFIPMRNLYLLLIALFIFSEAHAARLKDIANIRGVRENQLLGYGLIVGLPGTGDGESEFTSKSMTRMLDVMGMKVDEKAMKSKNVAAVMITASLPAFARSGNKIDVTVHSIGDASSLEGGTLLQTSLRAANKEVYAVAQGAVLVGSDGSGKGIKTVATVPNGAIIERDMDMEFASRKMLRLALHNADFTTSARTAHVINRELGGKYAVAKDSSTIDLVVPPNYEGNAVEFMAVIEGLDVDPDAPAKVVVNERTGTVVIGENVRISKIAISHGNITLMIGGDKNGKDSKDAKTGKTAVFGGEANVGEIVNGLNSLGISPKDLITILQNIKAAGALHGDLEVL
jgi:flagellar P-ring protein precursor FlgI